MPLLFPFAEEDAPEVARTFHFAALLSADVNALHQPTAALLSLSVTEGVDGVALLSFDVEGGSGVVVIVDLVDEALR